MTGTQLMEGEMLEDMLTQSEFYLPLSYDEIFPVQETIQLVDVNGVEAYEVRLSDGGDDATLAYFSTETGLMIRTVADIASPVGNMRTISDIDVYQEYDGEMIPMILRVDQGGQSIEISIDSVTFNDVGQEEFSPPSEVQSLL